MTKPLYCVYDRKARISPGPWPAENDEVAKRMFHGLILDKNTGPGQYPADFELRRVGLWSSDPVPHIELDQEAGSIIATGLDYLDN